MQAAAWFTLWGDDPAKRFFEAMKANGVRIAGSNGEVKRLVVSGEVIFGLTDTDDAFEAIKGGAPVTIVYPDQAGEGTLVMPTSVVLIKGGPHPGPARQLADFLITPRSEALMAESAAHMPLHAGVKTPEGVRTVGEIKTVTVDYETVAATMTRIQPWLRNWVGL
jgi:iron(III) transport system substrate-binding protein